MRYRWDDPPPSKDELAKIVTPYAHKLAFFLANGYGRHKPKGSKQYKVTGPHLHQLMFHCARNRQSRRTCRVRSLVAGRRGGKTMAAAWEVAYYLEHPEMFHHEVHGTDDDRPLHAWVISKDTVVSRAALYMLRGINSGAKLGWQENRTNMLFECPNESLLEMKTAVDPESLRGMGLDIIWVDEAAFIPTGRAMEVSTPALDDQEGIQLYSSTPDGRNWFWEQMFNEEALADPDQAQVEYRSIDNPHFSKERWELRKRTYHPILFKQEYEASFDSFVGRELPGEYLTRHMYTLGKDDMGNWDVPRVGDSEKMDVITYLGVDPASSLSDEADYFAMALWGVARPTGTAYLLRTYRKRIFFAEQLEVIAEWQQKYQPRLVGVEATSYQRVLAQQAMRGAQLSPIIPMESHGPKRERILAMAPLFKFGRCRVRASQIDFINEWLNYDSQLKNPQDDLLDAAEIGLRAAGALLADGTDPALLRDPLDLPAESADELAKRDLPARYNVLDQRADEFLGAEW